MNSSKIVIAIASIAAVTSIAIAAGNSGSAGKPLTTAPTYGETSNREPEATTMMDDHSESQLNRHKKQLENRKLAPRTSVNTLEKNGTTTNEDRGSGSRQ
jgi:hypothetical protein